MQVPVILQLVYDIPLSPSSEISTGMIGGRAPEVEAEEVEPSLLLSAGSFSSELVPVYSMAQTPYVGCQPNSLTYR